MGEDLRQRVAELERQLEASDSTLSATRRALADAQAREAAGLARERSVASILRLLQTSPTDRRAVFRAVLEALIQISSSGTLALLDGDTVRHVGSLAVKPSLAPWYDGEPHVSNDIPLSADRPAAAAIRERRTIYLPDIEAPEAAVYPAMLKTQRSLGTRSKLDVPIMSEGTALGVIDVSQPTVAPFDEAQIRLVEMLADQAAIAITNVKRLEAMQRRNLEVAEALERESATAEILRVMSASPADYQPVLDAIVASAAKVCGADLVVITLIDGSETVGVARFGQLTGYQVGSRAPLTPDQIEVLAIRERRAIHVRDIKAPEWDEYTSSRRATEVVGGGDSFCVPLLQRDEAIGFITVLRLDVRPFNEKEIGVIETFADQAVIAIENARLYQQLEAQRQAIAEVSQRKSEFLANMSHELRTPLNGIIGFAEVLLDPSMPVSDDQKTTFLGNILSSGHHLLALINDILDLAKVESGKMELRPEEFDLRAVLQGVHAIVHAISDKKRQTLCLRTPAEPVRLYYDPSRFKQILFNLLSNAVKFTPEGGSVTTTARLVEWTETGTDLTPGPFRRREGEVAEMGVMLNQADLAARSTSSEFPVMIEAIQSEARPYLAAETPPSRRGKGAGGLGPCLEIAVCDTGIGIAPEDQAKVFEEFQQVDTGYGRQQPGTGLGLALVRNFVQLMGGEITLRSAVGEGSTFTIRLPLRVVVPAASQAGEASTGAVGQSQEAH